MKPGDHFLHQKSGGIYIFEAIVENKTTDQPMILYRRKGFAQLYVRTSIDFHDKFSPTTPKDE